MHNIPISKVFFTEEEKKNILKPLKTGWVVQGPFVKEFEEKWSRFTNSKHSIAVSSCTTALHLSLVAMGIGYGDEVIIPAFTWVATANAVEATGAKPVFCDITLDTFNIDIKRIERLINRRTKAIIPVHLFGLPADMQAIQKISKKHNLFIIEDAACGFAAKIGNVHVGNFGNAGCFSFHPRKAITTGEGGMVTTNDDNLAFKLRAMRDHGATISDLQRHKGSPPYVLPKFPYLGFNYRMTDIQASIGSSQMDRADEILNRRKIIAEKYTEAFSKLNWLKPPQKHNNVNHGFQAYVCMFEPEEIKVDTIKKINKKRNKFMEYLFNAGISTRPGTHAVHILDYYRNKYSFEPPDFLAAYIADKCSIAFPIFPSLTESEQDYIIDKVLKYNL